MRGLDVLIVLFLFIYPTIAQNTGDHVYLSSIGAYRSTFDKVNYNTSSEIRTGNIVYSEGIQLYSQLYYSKEFMAYFNLNKTYNRLTGLIGIDDKSDIRDTDTVTLILTGDDKELQKITMLAADLPVNVDLDVSGVRRLALDATYNANTGTWKRLYIDLIKMILWKQPQV